VAGEAAAAPRIVSVTATLVRGRHTYASATTRGTKRPVLRTRRTLRPGYYVVKVVARTEDGRRLTGRSSVRLTKSLARKLRRR
jgi:hypothetical protein